MVVMKGKLILLAASLAMLLVATAALAQKPEDEFRCLLPEECGPDVADELLCFLPEGCDTNGDGVPDLRAGEPAPDVEPGPGAVQYDSAL
jgi:hypothetical protein